MIINQNVNFAGRIYPAGEDVKGKLPLDMIETLKSKGIIEGEAPQLETFNELESGANLEVSEEIPLPTVEGFADLKATEQKELLEKLGFEPASKVESRIKQYADFCDQEDSEGQPQQSAGTDPVADVGALDGEDDEHF